MIKKFKEFIKESRILYIEDDEFNESIHMLGDNFCVDVKTSLKLSKLDASYRYGKRIYSYKENIEELEDHFLRLKEVFNCHIEIQYSPVYELYLVGIHGDKYHIKELEQIKKRIEYIYKGFKMCTIMKYENNKYVTVNYICDSEIGSARVRDILSRIRGDWKTLDYLKESVN